MWSLSKTEAEIFRIKTGKMVDGSCRPWPEKQDVVSSQLKPLKWKRSWEQFRPGNTKDYLWKWYLRPGSQGRQWRYGDKNCNQTNIWLILPHCLFITWNCFYWLVQGDCFLEHFKGPSWYLIITFRPLFRDCVIKINQSLHWYNPNGPNNGFDSCVFHLSKFNSPGVIENNVLVLNYNKMKGSFLLPEVWWAPNSYQIFLWMWNKSWRESSI